MPKARAVATIDLEPQDPLQQYRALKSRARKFAESIKKDVSRLSIARAFCTAIVTAHWAELCRVQGAEWDIRPHGLALPSLPSGEQGLARSIGALVASFPVEDSGYLIGSIYTVMLPETMRSDMGAYYTPPPMVNRLLDLSEQAGTDFAACTAIDPACGGGAFLAPVALRMWKRTTKPAAGDALQDIAARLRGIELDPFAAWITQVLLEASLLPLCVKSGARFPQVITVGDALQHDQMGKFSLVIGNPPYGRVKLTDAMRTKYARSLYGHANLYGLFTDLALRLVERNGVIAYLTPTSFLGGQYFKALRKNLTDDTTPAAFDFIADRDGVFDDVLQETILVTYQVARSKKAAAVSLIVPKGIEQAAIESIGEIRVPADGGPWIIPRAVKDSTYVQVLSKMPARLVDFGYQVSTGQLVWNRHKPQLRQEKVNGELPIIWAESVTPAGFRFSAERRNHAPYVELQAQPHLVTDKSCVLLQRTTAKEQDRRLLSAVIPQEFIDANGGVVVENHLNIIYADKRGEVSPDAISAILNSEAADRAFRCISGSVAVSAYELEALPMPTIAQAKAIERLLRKGATRTAIEAKIASFYTGVGE